MKTKRRNYNRDRLSDLPDSVLIDILSTFNTKYAVQTCILSKRWKNLWKLLPVLSMQYFYFNTRTSFNKFVSKILSLRDDKTALHALDFYGKSYMSDHLLKRIIKYAFSHNVKILKLWMGRTTEVFPICYFSSHTLTSLNLTSSSTQAIFPNSLNFPALTYLSISFFDFRSSGGNDGYVEPFSAFKSLNTLIIDRCAIHDEENLFISSVTLVNLSIQMFSSYSYKFELSTPNLFSFDFKGNPIQNLSESNSNLSSIKHVSIDVQLKSYVENYPLVLLNWLSELPLMESLAISSRTLQILYLFPDLRKVDFPYLHNLKSLKIIMKKHGASPIPHKIVDFLLQNAPSAKISIHDKKKKDGDDTT